MAPPESHHQGDDSKAPVDFFSFVKPKEELNRDFALLALEEGYSPARQIIEPMMRWYEDADGNFVEQFQTTGFDQRIWELYLFASLVEMRYRFDRSEPAPDFVCSGLRGVFSIEAVTVGPTRKDGATVPPPPTSTPEQISLYIKEYMPIKFGSALYSKLAKQYWRRPNVAGKPFVLAIEDFSSPASMIHTRSEIEIYLYGYEQEWWYDIQSGFFDLPEAENISAVLFSNSGTIGKFNRMGILGGFGSPNVLVTREGTAINHEPNATAPTLFKAIVNSPDYRESWVEGMDVFHNPHARIPLPEFFLPGAAHHYIGMGGERVSRTPEWHPLGSITQNIVLPVDAQAFLQETMRKQAPR